MHEHFRHNVSSVIMNCKGVGANHLFHSNWSLGLRPEYSPSFIPQKLDHSNIKPQVKCEVRSVKYEKESLNNQLNQGNF